MKKWLEANAHVHEKKEKTEKRWAIDSPKHGILVFSRGDTKRVVARYVGCERGRRVVRVRIIWSVG